MLPEIESEYSDEWLFDNFEFVCSDAVENSDGTWSMTVTMVPKESCK